MATTSKSRIIKYLAISTIIGLSSNIFAANSNSECTVKDKIRFAFTDPSIAVTVAPYSSVPIQMGWFDKACIEFIMQPVNGAAAGIQAVATGNADISLSGVPGFYPYMIKDPGAFKMIYFYNNIYEIAVPSDSPINSLKDLKGKTIGVLNTTSSGSYYYSRAIVADAGLSPDNDVKWLPTGLGSQAAEGYSSGRTQALGLWDSVNAEIINGLLKKEMRTIPSPLNNLPAGGGFVASTDAINKHKDVFVRYLEAIYKGMVWANAHPKEAVEMHWKTYPVSAPRNKANIQEQLELQKKVLMTRMETIFPTGDQLLGYATAAEAQEYADKLHEFGLLKQKIDTSTMIDMTLTEKANKSIDRNLVINTPYPKEAVNWQ